MLLLKSGPFQISFSLRKWEMLERDFGVSIPWDFYRVSAPWTKLKKYVRTYVRTYVCTKCMRPSETCSHHTISVSLSTWLQELSSLHSPVTSRLELQWPTNAIAKDCPVEKCPQHVCSQLMPPLHEVSKSTVRCCGQPGLTLLSMPHPPFTLAVACLQL